MIDIDLLQTRLTQAVEELTPLVQAEGNNVEDEEVEAETRYWLDGSGPPLDWAGSGITPDEFFFITTLYGTMPSEGRRTHIRKFFPLFVREADRDIRNFTTALLANWKLRYPWMRLRYPWMERRLCQMACVLRQSGLTMEGYVAALRGMESKATLENPTPALDRIIRDHQAGGVKTLSVFIRDAVKGNCFPIDCRVENQLTNYDLPVNEQCLVRICLRMGQNPRKVARIFFLAPQSEAGGVEEAMKRFGTKHLMEAIGPAKIIEEMGLDWLVSGFSPEQLMELKQRLK